MVAGTEREPLLSQPSTQSGHVNETGKGRSKSIRDGLDDTESQSRVQVTVVEDIEGYGTVEDGGRRGGSDSPKDLRIARIIPPLGIGIFLAAMDGTIVASSYASIGSEMNQLQNTSWIATGYMLTLTSFQPLYGKLSDIFGRKACLLFAYSVFAIGCFLCGVAGDMKSLVGARALAGLGGGGMTTVVSILVSDLVPLRQRGTWQGILNIIFASGSATGAPLGGILADSIGWRWAFLAQVPFTILAIIAVSSFVHVPHPQIALKPDLGDTGPESNTENQISRPTSTLRTNLRRIDFLGALLLVLAVFTLLVALDRGGNVGWQDRFVVGCLVAGVGLFAVFVGVERGYEKRKQKNAGVVESANESSPLKSTPTVPSPEPFAPPSLILSRLLLPSYLANLLTLAASTCALFHSPLFFQAVARLSAAQAGVRLLPAVLGGVAGSLASGIVMQRSGKYWSLTLGMLITEVIGLCVIWTVGRTVGLGAGFGRVGELGMGIGLMIMSVGNGAGITTTLIALIASASQKDQAVATAVSYLFRSLGSVLGVSLGSTLVQNQLRKLLRERLSGLDLDIDVDVLADKLRSSLALLSDPDLHLPPEAEKIVRGSYADAVQAAFLLSIVCGVGAVIASWFIKEKALSGR